MLRVLMEVHTGFKTGCIQSVRNQPSYEEIGGGFRGKIGLELKQQRYL